MSSHSQLLLDQLADHVAVLADSLAVSGHGSHVVGGNGVAVRSLCVIKKNLDAVDLLLDGHWFVCVRDIPAPLNILWHAIVRLAIPNATGFDGIPHDLID